MAHQPIDDLEFFKLFEEVTSWTWHSAIAWPPFSRDTLGKQLVRSADSVGFNLVEGDGRESQREALHFFMIARASAREAELGLRRAAERKLVPLDKAEEQIDKLNKASRLLNRFIEYRRSKLKSIVREAIEPYGSFEFNSL